MAGIGESEKSLAAAKTLLAEMETTMSRVEKRTAALNAIKFSEQISDGNISLKETEEIYRRLGDDVDAVSEELKEIVERTTQTKNATIEWADQVNNVSKNLLGISMPALSVNGLLKAAVGTTIDWYNHTFEINRQMYDINAALGEAGTRGLEFESIISETALAFHAQFDEVRNVADGLADIGMNGDDIKDTLDDVFALTRNWSDITPEKQMSLMSDYMKEFGMNGKEAWATMNSLYVTTQDIRKDLPNLDVQKFVDQTQSVALSMRQYGLETQDAIAMTSTLARLGVEQARIPEMAERMGGIGLQQAPETAFMAQKFLMPEYQKELGGLREGRRGKEGPKTEREVELERLIGVMNTGVIGMIGVMETASAPDRVKAQMSMFETMLGTVGVKLSDPIEKIVGGLTAVDLPGIGKMNIESAKEFAKAAKVSAAGPEGLSITDALKAQYVKTVETEEAKANEAAKQRDEQIETAKAVSSATVNAADQLSIISENVGNIVRLMGGDSAMTIDEQRTFEGAKKQGYVGEFDKERIAGFQRGIERKAKAREAFVTQAKSPEEVIQYDVAAERQELGEFYQATKGEEAKQAAYDEFELGGMGIGAGGATSEEISGTIEVKVSMDDTGYFPTVVQQLKTNTRQLGRSSKLK